MRTQQQLRIFTDWITVTKMANTCSCEKVSITAEGLCSNCRKIVPWSKLNDMPIEARDRINTSGLNPSPESEIKSLQAQLKTATEKVIRISSIFDRIGSVLNVINYLIALIFLCASFIVASSGPNGGLVLGAGLLITALVWLAGWLQVAILRGLSAYFLMKGLAQKDSLSP